MNNPQHLIIFGEVHYRKELLIRTDEGEEAAPYLKLKLQRPVEPWQKLTHSQIVQHLVRAQASLGLVVCGGCGRVLEREFMHLDHIQPRAEGGVNDITNRILLCAPCNGRKSNMLTLAGLMRQNKQEKWMQDEWRAKTAQSNARSRADQVRDELSA